MNDGGPAFPARRRFPKISEEGHAFEVPLEGMSLLDHFAASVISPMLVQAYGNTPDVLAEQAYKIADAMLAERERRKGKQ